MLEKQNESLCCIQLDSHWKGIKIQGWERFTLQMEGKGKQGLWSCYLQAKKHWSQTKNDNYNAKSNEDKIVKSYRDTNELFAEKTIIEIKKIYSSLFRG